MLEVAAIIRLHGAAYLARVADRILPSHRRALRDLDACRTPALGATSISAITAGSRCTRITPAATVIARSVTAIRPNAG